MGKDHAWALRGQTLELLRLIHGYCRVEPYALRFEECAIVLDRPVSEAMNVYDLLMDQLRRLWLATPGVPGLEGIARVPGL